MIPKPPNLTGLVVTLQMIPVSMVPHLIIPSPNLTWLIVALRMIQNSMVPHLS